MVLLTNVTPEEFEETCFAVALVQRAKSEGENPVYYVLGQTEVGRYCAGKNLVLLDPDVAQAFSNEVAVNEALRMLMLIQIAQRQQGNNDVQQTEI